MHGLASLLAFSEPAKHGGFAAAARELGTSPSTLAKSVARFETSLGLRLFHRTTRQVTLTTEGERVARSLEAADDQVVEEAAEFAVAERATIDRGVDHVHRHAVARVPAVIMPPTASDPWIWALS